MATAYTWPATLPTRPRFDMPESVGVLILRTPMDKGPAKMRRLGERPEMMTLGYYMTTAQVATLETFVKDTIKGVYRFAFTHPRTQATVEARFVPGEDGAIYSVEYLAQGRWSVSMQLEFLP